MGHLPYVRLPKGENHPHTEPQHEYSNYIAPGFLWFGGRFFCLGEVPKRDQLLAISSATFRQSNVAEKSFTDFPSWKPPWLVWGFPMNFP